MKKGLLILALVFFIPKLHAQYYYNGRLTLDSGNCHYHFQISERYPKPQKHSIYYWYKSGQIHHSRGGYDGQMLDGPYSVSDIHHNLVEQGTFVKGRKTGVWKTWYPSQNIKSQRYYFPNSDIQNITVYDSAGAVIKKGTYKKGLFTGTVLEERDGKLITNHYKKGIKQAAKQRGLKAKSPVNDKAKDK